MELTNKIRKYRFDNGEMTQKALAERIGISRQTMNAIENCRHAPTVTVAIRIADVFHVSVDQLFDLDYDGKPLLKNRLHSRANTSRQKRKLYARPAWRACATSCNADAPY